MNTKFGGVIKMSTFMAKAETLERKWYILDAAKDRKSVV